MDAIDLFRYQIRDTYAWLEMTLEDISEEQANWRPPGTANSIGATYAHLLIGADFGLSSQIHGETPLMGSEFKGRVGLSEQPPFGPDWREWASNVRIDWKTLREYGRRARKRIESYVDALCPAELEMPIDMSFAGLGTWTGLDLYNLHGINHVRIHGGEIACLKGLQGGRGWSLGPVYPD